MRKFEVIAMGFQGDVINEKNEPYTEEEFLRIAKADWNHMTKSEQDRMIRFAGGYRCESYELDEDGFIIDDSVDDLFFIDADDLREKEA